ncbi:Protein-S-isoprenylcysteine O-methyltransferase Ste14 [Cohaesibacter sp. ES.047]|uniref:methyltransferase family protein n=1 Tax=Cohaesibacter sp. ES.047 TaxID=1798205 RepID=UPI000BB74843|nr:isoprenylcysteine carboxylmethyltransferase family protein [Cohaesibacter sp. ES.047]SNY90463.1 Protein-S-isoprenylcysteine O-methyltransferase Ste14 [Cohaesibacter sp. ES.047]
MAEEKITPPSPGISRAIPPLVFALCFVGALVLEWLFFQSVAPLIFLPEWMRLILGILVCAAGTAIMAWGFFGFKLSGTSPNPAKPASHLVDTGAFAISRNPMYVGLVAILLGFGVFIDSLPMLLAGLVMFVYLDRYVIRREEAYLITAFGESYRYYCHQVRRWL